MFRSFTSLFSRWNEYVLVFRHWFGGHKTDLIIMAASSTIHIRNSRTTVEWFLVLTRSGVWLCYETYQRLLLYCFSFNNCYSFPRAKNPLRLPVLHQWQSSRIYLVILSSFEHFFRLYEYPIFLWFILPINYDSLNALY